MNNECPAGMHYWHKYALETTTDVTDISELQQYKKSCFVHRRHGNDTVSIEQKFFAVNNFMWPPNLTASTVANSYDFVSERLEECTEKNDGLPIDLITVDYWHEGDIIEYVQRHNKKRGSSNMYVRV